MAGTGRVAERKHRIRQQVGALTLAIPSKERPLATPPAGSGLRPVPGRSGLPLVGEAFAMLPNPAEHTKERYRQYGPVSWGSLPGATLVIAVGPEALGEIFTNKERAFASGPAWGYFIGPFFDRGLMLLDFEEHLTHRRIMQEAFNRPRLEGYLAKMNEGIARAMDSWQVGADFKLYDAIKQMLLDVATEVFVGTDLGDAADKLNEAFIDTVVAGLSVVRADVPGGGWHRGIVGRQVLEEYFREQLPAKRRNAENGGDDLFSVLCRARTEDGEAFSDDDIVNHMIFGLMAAHDTSTITTAMVAYYIAAEPHWQQRLREESLALGKPMIDYADTELLPQFDLVFKEALRLNPPVGMVAREAVKDTSLLGHFIPQGTKIAVAIAASQRLEQYWTEPDTFDPDRFGAERREDKSHRWAWSPFGGGAHKCIGMHFGGLQVKAILHQLLLRYEWSVPAGYEPPISFATGEYPVDGLPVTLRPRR